MGGSAAGTARVSHPYDIYASAECRESGAKRSTHLVMRTPPDATPPVGGTIRRGVRSSPGQNSKEKSDIRRCSRKATSTDTREIGSSSLPTPQGTGRCCSDAASDRARAPQSWPLRCFFLKYGGLILKYLLYFVGKNSTPLPKRSGVLTCKGRAPGTFKRKDHDTAMPVLFTRGTTAPFIHPVRSGALALGGGLAFGCTERGPPPRP